MKKLREKKIFERSLSYATCLLGSRALTVSVGTMFPAHVSGSLLSSGACTSRRAEWTIRPPVANSRSADGTRKRITSSKILRKAHERDGFCSRRARGGFANEQNQQDSEPNHTAQRAGSNGRSDNLKHKRCRDAGANHLCN